MMNHSTYVKAASTRDPEIAKNTTDRIERLRAVVARGRDFLDKFAIFNEFLGTPHFDYVQAEALLQNVIGELYGAMARVSDDDPALAQYRMTLGILPQDAIRLRTDRAPAARLAKMLDAIERAAGAILAAPVVPTQEAAPLPYLVTLNQAAGMAQRTKRTIERHKKGSLPAPVVEGGGGKPDLYDWSVMRVWLEQTFGLRQPEVFPADRRHA